MSKQVIPELLVFIVVILISFSLLSDKSESELWNQQLRYYSEYGPEDLNPVVRILALEVWKVPESKYQVSFSKQLVLPQNWLDNFLPLCSHIPLILGRTPPHQFVYVCRLLKLNIWNQSDCTASAL